MKFTAKTALVSATLIGSALLSTNSHANVIEINDFSNDLYNPTFIGTLTQGVTTVTGSVGKTFEDTLDAFYFLPEAGFEISRLVNTTFNVTPTKDPECHKWQAVDPNCEKYTHHAWGHATYNSDLLSQNLTIGGYNGGAYTGSGSFYTRQQWEDGISSGYTQQTRTDSDYWATHPWFFDADVSTQNILTNNVSNTSSYTDTDSNGHTARMGWSSFDWQWDITISPIAGFQGNQASISNATTGSKTINANAPATASILGLGLIAMMLRKRRN